MAMGTSSPNYTLKIGGKDAEELKTDFQSFVIDRDMFQPDTCAIVLSNQGGQYADIKVADEVEIKVGDDAGESIFKGEVVGLEPLYKGGEKSRLLIRCMNRFHRLLRLRKSKTFADMDDQQILNQVCGDAGLTLEYKHEKKIKYKHVYQHNQTDMEFLRTRAARMGCHVWCVDKKVFVKEPNLQSEPTATFSVSQTTSDDPTQGTMKMFAPRLSAANILKKVTVRGWNPETKDLIVGTFSAQNSQLGTENAVTASGELGKEETFTVDHPIWGKEEADALAKAQLVDVSLGFITGECEVTGMTSLDLGQVVLIIANPEPDTKDKDPFNGRYYVMGLTHRFSLTKAREGGFSTIMRVARDAQKAQPKWIDKGVDDRTTA